MKKLPKYLLIACAAFVALIVAIELVLRFAFPVEPDIGAKYIFNNQIPGISEKVYFDVGTDLLRKRGWAKEDDAAAGATRVVCLGGPATVGLLQNVDDTWWGQLQQNLEQKHPGKQFQFGALAVESKGIRFAAKWADTYLKELKPDLVIVQHGVMDVLGHPESYEYDSAGMDKISIRRQRTGLKKMLINASQVVRRVSRNRQESAAKRRQKVLGQPNYHAAVLQQARAEYRELELVFSLPREGANDPLAEYLEGLKAIVAASRDADAKVLLVGEPSLCGEFISARARAMLNIPIGTSNPDKLSKPEPGWVEKELYRYYANGSAFAKEARVPFIGLHGQVPQEAAFFVNEAMLTNAGAKKVAELVLPEVEKLIE